jgi:hypothetical protein
VKDNRYLIHLGTFSSQTWISQFWFVDHQQIPRKCCLRKIRKLGF